MPSRQGARRSKEDDIGFDQEPARSCGRGRRPGRHSPGRVQTNYSYTIDNKTTKTQTVLYRSGSTKKLLGKLTKSEKAGVCLTGSKGAKGIFYISGASSVLTVTLS